MSTAFSLAEPKRTQEVNVLGQNSHLPGQQVWVVGYLKLRRLQPGNDAFKIVTVLRSRQRKHAATAARDNAALGVHRVHVKRDLDQILPGVDGLES